MTRMRFRRNTSFSGYNHDVEIIVQVLANRGIEIEREDAFLAWEQISESACAGWLCLPSLSEEQAATRDEDDLLRMPEEDGGAIFDAERIACDVLCHLEEAPDR